MADGSGMRNTGIDQRAFRDALGCFATGVTVVTCASEKGPLAITANSFASVSMDPPLVLWSPGKASRRHDPFVQAKHTSIHILGGENLELASLFAKDGLDFSHCDWRVDARGRPIIDAALARFDCTAQAAYDGGDHTILVSHVDGFAQRDGAPLIFAQGRYGLLQEQT